jgi:hypothetical protein
MTMPSRGMGQSDLSKMPKAKDDTRKDGSDKVQRFSKRVGSSLG